MARLKACSRCGKIHDTALNCYTRNNPQTNEQALRQKNRWKEKSKDIRERSLWLCAVCKDRGVINHESLEVHHIRKLRDYPEGLLEDDNLVCLCTEHHKEADSGLINADYLSELARKRDEA